MNIDIPILNGMQATRILPPGRPIINERQRRFEATDQDMRQAEAEREKPGVELLRGSDLTPKPISWLWPGWLPLGKLVLMAGAPGAGKTTAALSFAATVTVGGCFPDGSRCPVGDVLIWSGEDDPTDTLLPRLIVAGVNRDRIYFVGDIDLRGKRRPFDPATDAAELLKAAQRLPDLRLIVFDPLVNAVAGDSHKNTEVRRALQPLVDFAAQIGAVLIGITHFAKAGAGLDPTMRVIGSVAFSAVARVVMVCAKSRDDEGNERRILVRSKSNLGPDDCGFEYTHEQVEASPEMWANRTVWGNAVDGNAQTLLANNDDRYGQHCLANKAAAFLRQCLEKGLTPVKTVESSAKEAGIPWASIRRVADKLGVIKKKGGMNDGWYWLLPSTKDALLSAKMPEGVQEKKMGSFGHLRENLSAFEDQSDDPGEDF